MSENPQVKVILEHIEASERELASQAEQFPAHIEELTRQLGEAAAETERPDIPGHAAYQQILTALADADRPMRARDLCQTLDLPILPKNPEGIRSKLKRLVSRGILIEPEPGLFTRPGA